MWYMYHLKTLWVSGTQTWRHPKLKLHGSVPPWWIFFTFYLAPEKRNFLGFSLFLLRFCSGQAASCPEQLCHGPSVRTLHLLFFFQAPNTHKVWSCTEEIPDICRAPGRQWACSALLPPRRGSSFPSESQSGASMSARPACSGRWARRAGLCPGRCAARVSALRPRKARKGFWNGF